MGRTCDTVAHSLLLYAMKTESYRVADRLGVYLSYCRLLSECARAAISLASSARLYIRKSSSSP